ncbi:hypothetical protein AM493_04365 [Flavobacterium akiainvivens]|uniref:Uncharacterized protein n=1 Tax=Flavobacterium akiainvivens TaxID=1202724 RepID=A0A0N0RQK8_9FLAO|nr:hypothetical protein [Flavobacterium akiainvivens]KOS05349.1 hypothetical protein AM493_04365 [Flavobacterium akiainvivens]SFQ76779.1 hypothetical protein SAMN05444144_12427 [Flavobacterium akiainvivens]
MKKIISLLFLLVVVSVNAQTQIGKVAPLGSGSIILEKYDTYYKFEFKDIKYQTKDVKASFMLTGTEEDLQKLYDAITKKMEAKEEADVDIAFGEDTVKLHFEKNMGTMSFQFKKYIAKSISEDTSDSTYMTRKQIDKLFGKK